MLKGPYKPKNRTENTQEGPEGPKRIQKNPKGLTKTAKTIPMKNSEMSLVCLFNLVLKTKLGHQNRNRPFNLSFSLPMGLERLRPDKNVA